MLLQVCEVHWYETPVSLRRKMARVRIHGFCISPGGVGSREGPLALLSTQDPYIKVATSRTLGKGGHAAVCPSVSMNKATIPPSINQESRGFLSLKVKVTLRQGTGSIPRTLFLQDVLILNLFTPYLQKTQDPQCELSFWFDVQIFLSRSIKRHERTSR